MATYKNIQEYIKLKHGYTPKSCWIAHMKEVHGLNPKIANNRFSPNSRTNPCPLKRQEDIKEAFQHFSMI